VPQESLMYINDNTIKPLFFQTSLVFSLMTIGISLVCKIQKNYAILPAS
jgi:hypothetical protein